MHENLHTLYYVRTQFNSISGRKPFLFKAGPSDRRGDRCMTRRKIGQSDEAMLIRKHFCGRERANERKSLRSTNFLSFHFTQWLCCIANEISGTGSNPAQFLS